MKAVQEALTGLKIHTVTEVAVALRISKMTVYRMIHNGELESIRVGRSFRIPEEALLTYLKMDTKKDSKDMSAPSDPIG